MSAAATVSEALLTEKVIAILRGVRPPRVERVVGALRGAGLRFIEITVEASGGLETLAAVRSAFGDDICLGAGSILNAGQAEAALEAGARYLVSPGFFEDVSDCARARDVLYIPGVLTGTEVGQALRREHAILKLFPAGLMGPEFLRAMQAPYPRARFFAVGHVGPSDVATYLRAGAAGVAMGSQLVAHGDEPDVIAAKAREVVTSIRALARA